MGEPNALYYEISENSNKFAIKYLGVRRAYFSIERNNDGNVEGHIYEYLTYEGIGISSSADFYIDDDYVTAVGNKADGMIGFTGYICELYDVDTGKMLAYLWHAMVWFIICIRIGFNQICGKLFLC